MTGRRAAVLAGSAVAVLVAWAAAGVWAVTTFADEEVFAS